LPFDAAAAITPLRHAMRDYASARRVRGIAGMHACAARHVRAAMSRDRQR